MLCILEYRHVHLFPSVRLNLQVTLNPTIVSLDLYVVQMLKHMYALIHAFPFMLIVLSIGFKQVIWGHLTCLNFISPGVEGEGNIKYRQII